jgi:hypothetical protein
MRSVRQSVKGCSRQRLLLAQLLQAGRPQAMITKLNRADVWAREFLSSLAAAVSPPLLSIVDLPVLIGHPRIAEPTAPTTSSCAIRFRSSCVTVVAGR